MNSPVQAETSPVGNGWRYWSAQRRWTYVGCGAVLLVGAVLYASAARHASQTAPKPPEPVKQSSASEPFQPPALPKPTPVMFQPVRPVSTVSPSNLVQSDDPLKKARESDIMAVSAQSAGAGDAHPARPDGEMEIPKPKSELAERLTGTEMSSVRAVEMPNPDFVIAQGRIIGCVLNSEVDSSYPGLVEAIIPRAVRGETSNVIVLDAGAKVTGTIERGVVNGLSRIFILWGKVRTPPIYDAQGVPRQYAVTLNSPASDALGATGLSGDVDRHEWQKLKGAIMLSLLEGGIQAGTAALQPKGGTSINLSGGGLGQLPQTLLQGQMNIPDVIHINRGTACSIHVARDLDFSGIYKLRRR